MAVVGFFSIRVARSLLLVGSGMLTNRLRPPMMRKSFPSGRGPIFSFFSLARLMALAFADSLIRGTAVSAHVNPYVPSEQVKVLYVAACLYLPVCQASLFILCY